ncbi:sulfotransferase, partial [Primorskyibacter sp. 2E107]|uniref:sulfotransferase n=1 Tax=Primorskyibacter sp. 2E107 TaxID=3403458 RepID=UPI003AF79D01
GTLFIVTYGRSGSTLLQSLLQTIPGAHIRGENGGALQGLFQSATALRKAHGEHGVERQPPDHPWHGMAEVNVDGYEKGLAQVFVNQVLRPPQEARWIGFKEVRYLQMGPNLPQLMTFCRRVFHNPFFVFNSRNAEDVRQSKWWAEHPADVVTAQLRRADEAFQRYSGNHPRISHHVQYEDLVADPSVLIPLFDKLGEPFDAARVAQVMSKRLTH